MQIKFLYKYSEIKKIINELKKEHACIGMKLSTEDQGSSMAFIDFVNNRLLNEILPLNVKIGGPDAKNDINECLRIGASGIIAPMVESPFGINKFVTALQSFAGKDVMEKLLVSVNLESITAYQNIDEILMHPKIEEINQIVIGTHDLALSIGKPITDHQVIDMVIEMAQKSKRAGKIVRIGGIMALVRNDYDVLRRFLEETSADKLNTSNVCFSVKGVPDLVSAYFKALNYELMLNSFWVEICNTRIAPFKKRISNLKKKII